MSCVIITTVIRYQYKVQRGLFPLTYLKLTFLIVICKTCNAPVKMSPPTNQHWAFYRPDALPVAQPTVFFYYQHWKGKVSHTMNFLTQFHIEICVTGCDGLGSTGSLSHVIYMFIHLYVWFLCEKWILLLQVCSRSLSWDCCVACVSPSQSMSV